MRERIVNLLERKLREALAEIDQTAEAAMRDAWRDIDPSPKCPAVRTVLLAQGEALASGHTQRRARAIEVVRETLEPLRTEIDERLASDLLALVRRLFPPTTYMAIVEHTPGVYERKLAPPGKFDGKSYQHNYSLVHGTALNLSARAVREIETVLSELVLQERIRNPPWWKRLPALVWSHVGRPVVAWVAGILAAVVGAVLIYVLGVK